MMRQTWRVRPALRLAIAAMLLGVAGVRADTTVVVRPDEKPRVWEGWGASLCWWANQFGTRSDLADVLFTTRTVRLTTDSGTYTLPGLGLNIARYNIGGTSVVPAHGERPRIPDSMPPFKRIEGYWINGTSDDPSSSSFRWSADASQRKMLSMARARGVNRLEAFSNAPMWWMTRNRSTAGSDSGGDNLEPEHYRTFARYLAIVVKNARDHWGIAFDHVAPFNEPSAWWWKYPGGQEGCHFDIETQKQVIGYLRSELDSRGLQSVGISASEENSVDDALNTWRKLGTEAKSQIARVNFHGYSGQAAYRGPNRKTLFQEVFAAGKPLWNSEYGEGDGSGKTMAQSLMLDLNEARVSGWVYWQPFDSGGWGLVQSNPGDNWIGPPNPKFYVMAQFSRHIRPGMALLKTDDPNTVAAYDKARRGLVLVTVNGATGRQVSYDLSGLGRVKGPITRWSTATGEGDRYVRRTDTVLAGNGFTSWFDPDTVQTFEVENVSLADSLPGARTMDNQPSIATTDAPARPAFHHPAVQAVRPGTPLLFRLPVTGAAPLTFAVEGLPDGVSVDKATGIVSGVAARPGMYPQKATARNARGTARATLTLVVGDTLAPVPPMGWNSYDGFGDSVTEQEVLANARYMAGKLQPYGWEYVVVDYRWYDPKARSSIANLDPSHHVMDEYGRLLPAENRFPSAAGGKGFRPLADQVHAMGLKFGIHVMRGISRIAVEKNLPIAGSRFRARDAADTSSTCAWNPDMLGVRGDTEAGQAWYDAIIRQYAEWHVDFLKIDDLSAPTYHRAEVEAIRRAIDRCGRSIVLSTSPGETPLSASAHVKSHANMWRIQNDVWDQWRPIDATFDLGDAWVHAAGPGHWPDADMLPLGHLALRSVGPDRRCALSRDEQVTMMTLWAILPSPLMTGGHLPDNDPWTLSLLTNDEVLAVNQDPAGTPARRAWTNGDLEAWQRPLSTGATAVALFNRGLEAALVALHPEDIGLSGPVKVRDLWRRRSLGRWAGQRTFTLPSHGALFLEARPEKEDQSHGG